MAIHQIQVRYDAMADRLLLQVRTITAQVYPVWLTRRMTARLYPHFRDAVARAGIARASPEAMVVPEARRMMEEAALQRPLAGAEFDKPFADANVSHPLGREPLLAATAQLTPRPDGQLALSLQEDQGRRLDVALGDDLAAALLRLLDAALVAAEWNLPGIGPQAAASETAEAPTERSSRLLN